jgi:hypothetical protein
MGPTWRVVFVAALTVVAGSLVTFLVVAILVVGALIVDGGRVA